MGIYACPRCGNPNGWWSGNMRDVHDCPGPPRRQWPQRAEYPPQLDWSEADGNDGVLVRPAPNRSELQRWAELCEKGHGQAVALEIQRHLDGVQGTPIATGEL